MTHIYHKEYEQDAMKDGENLHIAHINAVAEENMKIGELDTEHENQQRNMMNQVDSHEQVQMRVDDTHLIGNEVKGE